jgi:hypothetical protein
MVHILKMFSCNFHCPETTVYIGLSDVCGVFL